MRTRTFTCVGCLKIALSVLACFWWQAAQADRDIVFAMKSYRWSGEYYRDEYTKPGERGQEKLADIGANHLYRINPDGSGRTQLTFGKDDDIFPSFSPDRKHILFRRRRDYRSSLICILPAQGGRVRRLYRLPGDCYDVCCRWSPDGRYVSVFYRGGERYGSDGHIRIVNVKTGKVISFDSAAACAWSPDSRRLYLLTEKKLDGPYSATILNWPSGANGLPAAVTLNPAWITPDTLLGDMPPEDDHGLWGVRILDRNGKERRRQRLSSYRKAKTREWEEGFGEEHTWHPVPNDPHYIVLETKRRMSDGGHFACFLVDLKTGRWRKISDGILVGIAPQGDAIATARWEWEGPYKEFRGGRRVGPLEIITLRTGISRSLTRKLVAVYGGAWRISHPRRKRR